MVGCSKDTALKQKDLKRILGVGIGLAGYECKKKNGRGAYYRYFDLTAGPGIYRKINKKGEVSNNVIVGSPLLAMDSLIKQNEKFGLGFHVYFFDKTKRNLELLHANLERHYQIDSFNKRWVNYIHGDYRDEAFKYFGSEGYEFTLGTRFPTHPLGMVYCDTNGGCPDFHFLARMFGVGVPHVIDCYRRIDLLVHLQIGLLKKNCAGIYGKFKEHKCLIKDEFRKIDNPSSCLFTIPKKYIYARECVDNKKKSTLVLFTNWAGYADKWQKHGFMDDKESREMLMDTMMINSYRKELAYA
jgi:hypothetical protein